MHILSAGKKRYFEITKRKEWKTFSDFAKSLAIWQKTAIITEHPLSLQQSWGEQSEQ